MEIRKTLARSEGRSGLSVLTAAGIVLMPKCPLCCAAYLGLLSSVGIASLPAPGWILSGLAALLLGNLVLQGLAARKHERYGPFILSVAGTAAILSGKLWFESDALSWTGVAVILAGAAWNFAANRKAAGLLVVAEEGHCHSSVHRLTAAATHGAGPSGS